NPYGVGVDGPGNLYVADTSASRVLEYNAPYTAPNDNLADRAVGQTTLTNWGCNVGGITSLGVCSPRGISFDGTTLWVSDTTNHRLLRYVSPLTTDLAADGVLGQNAMTSCGPNLVDASGMYSPYSVALDSSVTPNRVYVADEQNHRVLGWPDVTAFANGDPATV